MIFTRQWSALVVATGAILSLASPDTHAQQPTKAEAKSHEGLEVGSAAPKFTLMDQDGTERSLDQIIKKGKVSLVFTRSADW